MSENLRKYFTTGEFAKLCNVKKQTLFHYDEIGLLSPEIKNEKGYRYYSYHQFDVFNVIELLKEVDMPLKEIKLFLNNKTPDELIELLKGKSLEIKKKINNLNQIQKIIDTKIALTENALKLDFNQISLEIQEEELLFLSDSILDCSARSFLKSVSHFIDFLYKNELDIGYPIGAMVNRAKLMEEDYDNYSYLYTKTEADVKNITFYTKPKGLYVVAYHVGNDKNISKTYKEIMKFIDKHQIKLGSYSYEEYILDEISVSGNDNYVTQILVEVEEI
ncbi:MerR family transcriptional regulator [Psychrobacillus psychrodurans]|uniref:MerR family transcriptional regulator n=2 Tax=Psychrobacillus TaxID=1221880 RepID=A0A9X3R941_9BACI|nr:MerR family transcriptional regulator [Psychrobacillus psychrodurans]MCZ8532531.1 MerR family transcriptional regulator [Psychrobacillus psychrodurans]